MLGARRLPSRPEVWEPRAQGPTAAAFGTAYNGNSVVRNDKRQVTFRSSNPAVASVNPTTGQIVGLTPGVAEIIGESGGKRGTDSVIVRLVPARSVVITSRNPRFRVGAINGIQAVARDSANNVIGDRQVAYRSTNEAVLTVANGVVTPRAVGAAQIIATVENGLGGGASVADTVTATVTLPPIAGAQLTPLQTTRVVGETQQYSLVLTDSLGATATGRSVTYISSNSNVATISATGLATAVAPGGVAISAVTDRVPGEAGQFQSGTVGLTVVAPPSASTTSNQTTVALRVSAPGPTSVVVALGVRDANGGAIVGRAIRAFGFDPNVVQVTFSADFSQAVITARTAGATIITFQSRDAANQQDQGSAVNVQVNVTP